MAFTCETGYLLAEVRGRNPRFLQGPQSHSEDRRALREGLAHGEHVHQLILNSTKAGHPIWFNMHVSPSFEHGLLRSWVAVQEDASTRVEAQRWLEWVSSHDLLTERRNRHGLEAQLRAYVERTVQRGGASR